jgi:hypothetical protein
LTSITPLDRFSALPPVRLPIIAHAGLVAAVAAFIVLLGAVCVLTSIVTPMEMDRTFTREIAIMASSVGRADKACGTDGSETGGAVPNCLDYKGFRIVKGERLMVFSMRYSKPLFVFGIQSGIMFVNEQRNSALVGAEKSAIFRYLRDAG